MKRRQRQVLSRHRIPLVDLDRPLQDLAGADRHSGLGEHQSEHVQRLGIARIRVALHQPDRVRRPADLGQRQRQLTVQRSRSEPAPLGVDHDAQRFLHLALFEQRLGQDPVAEAHFGPAFDHPAGQALRLPMASCLERLRPGLDRPVEVHQPLRVVLRSIALGKGRAAGRTEVTETLERPPLLLTHRADRRRPLGLLRQQGREARRNVGLGVVQVRRLGRIGVQVVELGLWQRNVLQEPAVALAGRLRCFGDHAAERRPPALQVRLQRLEVGGPAVHRRAPQTAPRHLRQRLRIQARRLHHGRQNVDMAHGVVVPRRRQFLRPQHERHLQRLVVGEQAVRLLAVLTERLAVVGRHDDQHAAPRARRRHLREQTADMVVGGGDLAQVRLAREP